MHRVAGLPFIVSEYDHPAPSEYAAEGVLSMAVMAALQDWDGVFLFCWNATADPALTRRNRISSFFDLLQHPAKRARRSP